MQSNLHRESKGPGRGKRSPDPSWVISFSPASSRTLTHSWESEVCLECGVDRGKLGECQREEGEDTRGGEHGRWVGGNILDT